MSTGLTIIWILIGQWFLATIISLLISKQWLKYTNLDNNLDPIEVIIRAILFTYCLIPMINWGVVYLLKDKDFQKWRKKERKKTKRSKWIFILIISLFFSTHSNGQVFITTNPMQGHHNIGTLINIPLDNDVGIYGNVLHGNIKYTDFKCNNSKFGVGISYTIPNDHKDVYLLLGFSSNNLYNIENNNPNINTDLNTHTSVNIGFFADLPFKHRPKILALTDINNWETQLGISFNF